MQTGQIKKREAMKKTLINPPGTEGIYQSMQFSQAIRMGHMIWISGQVGMDRGTYTGLGDCNLWSRGTIHDGC